MAYAAKYRTEFKDYFNRLIRVDFMFQDFAGSITELKTAEGTGEIYQPENETNIFHPIRGSELRIDLISETDFQLIDLFVVNKRDCLVQVEIDSTLFWQGWLIPNQYSERYDAAPYPVTVTARDGLAELKTYTYDLTGYSSPVSILAVILNKLNFSANLWESVNIYEVNYMDSDVTDSMLNQCFFNTDNYVGMTYYDVLADILTGLGAEIQQINGDWKITRIAELNAELIKRRIDLDFSGDGTDQETENHLRLIGRPQNRDFANVDAEILASPGWNNFVMKRDAGRKYGFENHKFDGDYETITSGQIAKGWTHVPGTQLERWKSGNGTVQRSTSFNANISGATYGISQLIFRADANTPLFNTQRLIFKVSVAVSKQYGYSNDNVLCGLRTAITIWDGTNTYYLNPTNGSWSTTINFIDFRNITANEDRSLSFVSYEVVSNFIPVSGPVTMLIYAPFPESSGDAGKLLAWYINEASIDGWDTIMGEYDENGRLSEIQTPTISVNQNMSYVPNFDVQFKFGDFPGFKNSMLLYKNGLIQSWFNFIPTIDWQQRGGDIVTTLQVHLRNGYISHYGQNRWIIRGTILSQDVYFDNAIVDYQVNNRVYYCKGGTYNLRTAMLTGVFHEIGNWAGAPWILETGTWNDNGIWIDNEVWNDGE
jgi:hypothetical protein